MILLQVPQQLSKETPLSQPTAPRRHQAINTYLAEDKVEDLCRPLACSKSWLDTWRGRYDAQNPAWAQERSQSPKSHPTHTPERVEQAVVSLHLTLLHNGPSGGATAIMQALTLQGREPLPSRRTIDRLLHRPHKEVKYLGSRSSIFVLPVGTGFLIQQELSTLDVCCSSPEPEPSLENV
jgi:hypothetical protein